MVGFKKHKPKLKPRTHIVVGSSRKKDSEKDRGWFVLYSWEYRIYILYTEYKELE